MNLMTLAGNVTGDLYAQCTSLLAIDNRYISYDIECVLGCLDAPEKINTGRMVNVGPQIVLDELLPAAQFQSLRSRG